MRRLTAKQKKLLDKFIESCKNKSFWEDDTWGRAPYVIPEDAADGRKGGGVTSLHTVNMSSDLCNQIEALNPYETFSQDAGRYLGDQSFKLAHERKQC